MRNKDLRGGWPRRQAKDATMDDASSALVGGGEMPSSASPSGPSNAELPEPPPPNVIALWNEVAVGLDKSATVVWTKAVESLESAKRFLATSSEGRRFVDKYMGTIISILLEQQPAKIGQMEKDCVEKSLRCSLLIVAEDLVTRAEEEAGECTTLEILANVFNKKKAYYKGPKANWNATPIGLPEVRLHMISCFRRCKGFAHLAAYLLARASTPQFPPLDVLHLLLAATLEAIPSQNNNPDQVHKVKAMEEEARLVSEAVMKHLASLNEETLKRQTTESLTQVRFDLQRIYERLTMANPRAIFGFYVFWRSLVLKLITSQSLPLKLFGWEQIADLIDNSHDLHPPPRAYIVSGAGCTFINGRYDFSPAKTEAGYVRPGLDASYERIIPNDAPESEGRGKKLTLFRCTMRSQHKWWFLSEADEEQPGTDKDIDYYQHKSKPHEEGQPPLSGWFTCRSGVDPPPILKPVSVMVPYGEEYNTLEHQLAKWAIENRVIELVLGDSIHREIVARSTSLIKFLASMCQKDDPIEGADPMFPELIPNQYCLKASHLLLAWKTCINKADAAVSAEIYQLLVSILPSLSEELAIPLIKAIRDSLMQTPNKGDHFFEVSEFCCAIASANITEGDVNNANNNGSFTPISMKVRVREEILSLMWAILTHEDAWTLKSYENIKKYLSNEIQRLEPMASRQRDKFLTHCRDVVVKNSGDDAVDEPHALHMVQLTRFVLEAHPRDKADGMITSEKGSLPDLLLSELTAYLNRRAPLLTSPPLRKPSSNNTVSDFNHAKALTERLQILRFVYGLSSTAEMTNRQLDHLWSLCKLPVDREALMSFLASASNSEAGPPIRTETFRKGQMNQSDSCQLYAAFSSVVCVHVFENLFCSANVGWERLGEDAYQSFQTLFESFGRGRSDAMISNDRALDALWNICLSAGNDHVASRAMTDLLSVYNTAASVYRGPGSVNAWNNNTVENDESFSKRIFDCLVQVKEGLQRGDVSSERSAERCIRILNAAIDQCNSLGGRASAAAERIASLPLTSSVLDFLSQVPHGMRGQSSCRTISVMAKGIPQGNPVGPSNATPSTRDESGNSVPSYTAVEQNPRGPRCERFSLDVHPLETLSSIKAKVAAYCSHDVEMVKPSNLTCPRGPIPGRSGGAESARINLNIVPDTSLVADMGIIDGCEMVVLLVNKPLQVVAASTSTKPLTMKSSNLDLSDLFSGDRSHGSTDLFFETLISVLESLPVNNNAETSTQRGASETTDTHSLVWDLLLAMPTNSGVIDNVRVASSRTSGRSDAAQSDPPSDAMIVDSINASSDWPSLLEFRHFERSVYVTQVIDSFLRPAPEIFSSLPHDIAATLSQKMHKEAQSFLSGFTESGGFDAVMNLFIESGSADKNFRRRNRMGNACALRILAHCLVGNNGIAGAAFSSGNGQRLIKSLNNPGGFLKSLVGMVVDEGVADDAILSVLQLVRLMLISDPRITASFAALPGNIAETFLTSLLLWEGSGSLAPTSVHFGIKIRKNTEDMLLAIPLLSSSALPWLVKALVDIDPSTEGSDEFFSVLMKLVGSVNQTENCQQLKDLGTAVCNKLASYPRPNGDNALVDFSTGVLCGCLKLLIALIETNDGAFLVDGSYQLLHTLNIAPWSQDFGSKNFHWKSNKLGIDADDKALIDLMGSIFDGFISSSRSPGLPPVCCDKVSRQHAFNVLSAAARACSGGKGYSVLVTKIRGIISTVAPALRHCWGQNASPEEGNNVHSSNVIKYSGLRNQGCTCYMNSVLQQLFMMPALRKNLCSAAVPSSLRSSGGGALAKGGALVGKKISLHWDCGNSYDAIVDKYDEKTGMHTVTYCPVQLATAGSPGVGHHHQQQLPPPDLASLPKELPEEFIISEGRPGKETGTFEILFGGAMNRSSIAGESSQEGPKLNTAEFSGVEESDDEASSRRLLEEVQRTFVNLDEARGRCFDPRSLVEASNCLKLEFDVWQQNDASEFAMKLLDRLEISLKRWSPTHFKYLAHTFGLKQTKQKICKECGLKTNREENLMNIDCQIRNKSNIHEALSTMCEDEIMEGDNKVLCDRCKIKTNTVLRTAISALPDVLVLSLKRFDLDYNTFETVKLNSRCEFGEALNMKRYTLEGKEILEAVNSEENKSDVGSMMDLGDSDAKDGSDNDPLSALPDEDYEYRLAGVLVHAGVAQGGHYYSFIKDRTSNKWYRFDDEDVTLFDPNLIEQECFGGKVKKETKFPNGHVHTVESEQYANALMLFYEKVKPVKFLTSIEDKKNNVVGSPMEEEPVTIAPNLEFSSGYDVFLPEVRKSNSTHSWQSFLLSTEFQSFVKEIVGLCIDPAKKQEQDKMDISTPVSSPSPILSGEERDSWRIDIVSMSLSYVFDVLFHLALEKDSLNDWSSIFTRLFLSSSDVTSTFVTDLARRTGKVYENWIRAYTVECSEELSRRTAIQIFISAIHSQTSNSTEKLALQNWVLSWRTQVQDRERLFMSKRQHVGAMPTKLEGTQSRVLEDVANIGGGASAIGIILSFLSVLIELSPRYAQNNVDVCFFIRELASLEELPEGQLLREAMIEAQFPARLTCLAVREKSPSLLKIAFPGSSLAYDIADAISKNETLSSNILHLSGGAVGMANTGINGGGSPHVPSPLGNLLLLEALGCLLNMPWVKRETIVSDTGESNRGRAIVVLTPAAVDALTAVFEESKPKTSSGMSKRDIQIYMKRCGIDNVPPQRIESIMNKHSTIDETDGSKEMRQLNLGGFLAYYRDAAHGNDFQVRAELHAFGFRPNLTRRPEEARWWVNEAGSKRPCLPAESIAGDIAINYGSISKFSKLAEAGMMSLHFLNFGCTINEPLAEYLLGASAYGKDTTRLILDALKAFHQIAGNWGATELFNVCLMVFKVLTAIPDERQNDRIALLMTSDDKMKNGSAGLMVFGEDLINRYANDYHYANCIDRYAELIKELQKQRAVARWMLENRSHWSWLEPETRPEGLHTLQSRSDYSGRRGGGVPQHQSIPSNHHNHSDSDANAAINDSDDDALDDDDDSRYEPRNNALDYVLVKGCGIPIINGQYKRCGSCDGVPKYSKVGLWEGKEEDFMLFRCKLSDETRRWYISIVPSNIHPGTTKDIDFYAAPADNSGRYPPKINWMTVQSNGVDPPPQISPKPVDFSDGDGSQSINDVVFGNDGGSTGYL